MDVCSVEQLHCIAFIFLRDSLSTGGERERSRQESTTVVVLRPETRKAVRVFNPIVYCVHTVMVLTKREVLTLSLPLLSSYSKRA